MKRLLLFCMIMTVSFSDSRAQIAQQLPISTTEQSPILEISDDQEMVDQDSQELLDATVAVEPPIYMRWLMKIGSETAAHIIYLHRAIVAQCKKATTWLAGS